MKFLRKIKGVTVFDKVRNNAIREFRNIELLLPRIKISQLWWFGRESKMPQKQFPK